MTTKNYDYSKLFNLLDEEKLKEIGTELASQVLSNTPIEYEDYEVKIRIPCTVMNLLKILTEILPLELEDILSKMASQGLNNMLQGAIKDTTQDNTDGILDNIEPLNELTNQFSDLQNAISQFTNIQKVFEDLQHGTGNKHQEKDKKIIK